MGDSSCKSAKSCHFFRLHEHIVGLLQILFDLDDIAQISENSEGGDLFVLIVDDAAGKPHRDLMTILMTDAEFVI